MEIAALIKRSSFNKKNQTKRYQYFEKLISEIQKKSIPDNITNEINNKIDQLNKIPSSDKNLFKQLRVSKISIFKILEKELKIVPKNLYMVRWMSIGLAAFGIPLGVSFGLSLDNMAFLGTGLPIGLVIGMAIGAGMDKTALKEGRQLDIEMN